MSDNGKVAFARDTIMKIYDITSGSVALSAPTVECLHRSVHFGFSSARDKAGLKA